MNPSSMQQSDLHQRVKLLLPWYIKRSLEPKEQRMVEKHVDRCLRCRHELIGLRKLDQAVNQSADMDVAADISFASLQNKMHKHQELQSAGPARAFLGRIKPQRSLLSLLQQGLKVDWLRAGMGFAVVALLLLFPLAWMQQVSSHADTFYTLSAGKPELATRSQLRVVFSQGTDQTKVHSILAKIGAQQVEGPNSMGAFTITLDTANHAGDLIAAVSYLREQSDVIFAEPVLQP